jgi:hypothetical protein
MADTTYSLQYDGQTFVLLQADYDRLKKVYSTGMAVSSVLFSFIAVGEEDEVTIAIGSGAQFVVRTISDDIRG